MQRSGAKTRNHDASNDVSASRSMLGHRNDVGAFCFEF